MIIRGDSYSIGGFGKTSSDITLEIKKNYVREHYMNDVYDFTIEMIGDNKEYWYTYLTTFLEDTDGNSGVFREVNEVLEFQSEPAKLIFTSFIVDIGFG